MTYQNNPFQLKPAIREAVPVLVGLWGPSGSGKTLSALRMARGLAGPSGKIAFIDTERGLAKIYADKCRTADGEPWLHLDLQEPYTPERYKQAFQACEAAGCDVVIIDSMSHVWEGEGGVMDQAMSNDLKGLAKWQAPKMALKSLTNYLLKAPFHVIYCIRAKEKVEQKGRGRDMEITPHVLRHTAATHAAMSGADLGMIAALLGDDIKTVQRVYAKHTPEYLNDAVGWL